MYNTYLVENITNFNFSNTFNQNNCSIEHKTIIRELNVQLLVYLSQTRYKRDAPLAYPHHIKNYKVNPFKETDWANFWAQVKYDWDTDEFEWVRQEIGDGLKKLFKNGQNVRSTLSTRQKPSPPFLEIKPSDRQGVL